MVVHEGQDTDTAPALTRVVVVCLSEQCLAVEALKSLALDFEAVVVKDEYTYGETMHRYWQMGDTFINVEHDIIPYPGALEALDQCPYQFCGYDYPIGHAGLTGPCRGSALGCVKFGSLLIGRFPDLSEPWQYVNWNGLDAAVFASLRYKLDDPPEVKTRWTNFCWHNHTPAVSHLSSIKRLDTP